MASTVDSAIAPLKPVYKQGAAETKHTQDIIAKLGLLVHPEGGYYVETDRDTRRVPNPFALSNADPSSDPLVSTRSASTTIHYLLTPKSPLGHFHRNKGRTVHTLHKGRGRYVIIHADEVASTSHPGGYGGSEAAPEGERWTGKPARIETFVVGHDVLKGEKLQWIVEGGKYKSSFLLPDKDAVEGSEAGLLISETVVPGFEFTDHDFMEMERLKALVHKEQVEEMAWMIRKA